MPAKPQKQGRGLDWLLPCRLRRNQPCRDVAGLPAPGTVRPDVSQSDVLNPAAPGTCHPTRSVTWHVVCGRCSRSWFVCKVKMRPAF